MPIGGGAPLVLIGGPCVIESETHALSLGGAIVLFALALTNELATRNLPGALIVGGGALAKTLYDRRRSRSAQRREGDRELIEQAHRDD